MTDPTHYAIEAQDVWRVYTINGGQEVAALRGVNLRLPAGGFYVLKGRSGSGKTTLLNILGGLDQPTRGTVRVLGRDLASLSDRERTAWRSTQLGLVFQSFGLVQTLSAYENVDLMLRLAGVRGRTRQRRAEECLEMVGMEAWMNHRPGELSGGQQQRVAIARALANSPRLILADEPTGELDSITARDILLLFQEIRRREGAAILMTSHDPSVDHYVDGVLTIQDGQVVEYGETLAAAH